MRSKDSHEVRIAVIPVRALRKILVDDDPLNIAASNVVMNWMKKARKAADKGDPVGCLGCERPLIENLTGGFAVMLSKDTSKSSFGFAAGICRDCMESKPPDYLHHALGFAAVQAALDEDDHNQREH